MLDNAIPTTQFALERQVVLKRKMVPSLKKRCMLENLQMSFVGSFQVPLTAIAI
jgi:hypothetical protein